MDNKQHVQIKFNQYCNKYQGKDLSKPEERLLRETTCGILRSGHVYLTRIGSSLEESIQLKKTCKRFSYHLGKADFHERLNETHLSANRSFLSRCKYLIVDGSDVTKPFAREMEGLGRVHDGSTGEINNGYWQLNLIGVGPKSSSIVLATSRLYSYQTNHEPAELSENGLILSDLEHIDQHISKQQTVVIDRGGDRRVLIERFPSSGRPFIIRQTGKRHIEYYGKRRSVATVGKETELKWTIDIVRHRGGKRQTRRFECGAVRVKFPYEYREGSREESLWLVTVKRPGKQRCYFLSYINAETAEEAVHQVMEGYGCRWKIEEVHRQLKQDYNYESISLRRYLALRNFNTLFWITMGFLYQQLEDISLKLILEFREPLIYTGRLGNMGTFYLYKLSRVVRDCFLFTKIRGPSNRKKISSTQLVLAIE